MAILQPDRLPDNRWRSGAFRTRENAPTLPRVPLLQFVKLNVRRQVFDLGPDKDLKHLDRVRALHSFFVVKACSCIHDHQPRR